MRIILTIIAFTILVSTTAVFGQSDRNTQADLTRLKAAAAEKRKSLPNRMKTSTTGYDAGFSSELLFEFGPNDTMHYVTVHRGRGRDILLEGIRIGAVIYHRNSDGSWTKQQPPGNAAGSGIGNGVGIGSGLGIGSGRGTGSSNGTGAGSPELPPEVATEYFFLGNEKLDGQDTVRYRTVEDAKYTTRTPAATKRMVHDYWFRTDGAIVKETSEDGFENSDRHYSSTTTYEYPADLKITAPIPD